MGSWGGYVLGKISPEELGYVMGHEHLLSLTPGPWLNGGNYNDEIDLAINAVKSLPNRGFNTIVDLSPYGVVGRDDYGSNAAWLKELSSETGIHIVSGTGTYLDAFSPQWVLDATLDELTERFIQDATIGIGNSGVIADIYGEQATGLNEITPNEEKGLRAVARASLVTGLAIKTHTTHGTMALDQIAILKEEGVDLSRVVIGHIDTQQELSTEYAIQILNQGVNIGIDTIGKQTWEYFLSPPPPQRPDGPFVSNFMYRSDNNRIQMIAELVSLGYVEQLFLGMDLTGAEVYMNPKTEGQNGYNYLHDVFIPKLITAGELRLIDI